MTVVLAAGTSYLDLSVQDVRDLRKGLKDLKQQRHSRWAEFAYRCLRWEEWSEAFWMVLVEAVDQTMCASLYENLVERCSRRLRERIESDFHPVIMQKKGLPDVTASTVMELAVLADNHYLPRDEYMRGFVDKLQHFIYSIVVRKFSSNSVTLVEKELRKRTIMGTISVVLNGTISVSLTRMRAVSMCLSVIRPASEVVLSPHTKGSWKHMDFLRVANSVVHLLLFQAKMTPGEGAGILNFLEFLESGSLNYQMVLENVTDLL